MNYAGDQSVEEILLENIEIDEFLSYMGWTMRKQGTTYRSSCPIHGGDNPSAFSYSPKRRKFYCHTHCGSIGNLVMAYARAKQVTREKAILELASWRGISVKGKKVILAPRMVQRQTEAERAVQVATLPLLAEWERKGLYPLKSHPRFSADVIAHFGLMIGKFGRYRNRIVFPVHDIDGRWVGVSARWNGEDYGEENPKYLNSVEPFEKTQVLYGAHLAKDAPYWLLHEGVTDVVRAYTYGYYAEAVLGSSMSESQVELIRRQPKPVILAFDGDDAGRKATKQAITLLFKHHVTNVLVMEIPAGKDPDNLSREEYDRLFQTKIPAVLFLTRCA